MNREAPDLDAALAPLATRGAPAGFAARLSQRYVEALAVRRRRTALALCAACSLTLAALVVAVACVAPAPSLHDWLTGLTSIVTVIAHAAVRPIAHASTVLVVGLVVMAALGSACCVMLAAVVRGEALASSRVQ